MGRVQDLKHLDVVLTRYLNFQMDDLTVGHIAKNIFMEYPITENMRDNLNINKYKADKLRFKHALEAELKYVSEKSVNIGDEGFMAQTIYIKLSSLIKKILDSPVFDKY